MFRGQLCSRRHNRDRELPEMTRAVRPLFALSVATVLAIGTQLFSLNIAEARPSQLPSAALSPTASTLLNLPADPGASDLTDLGASGWEVQSSAVATQTGAQISTPGFNTSRWLPVANDDAGAPGTEIEALTQNGKCPGDTALQPVNQSTSSPNSVFFSNNMQLCYGSMNKIGPDTVSEFSVPWWWRTDFTANLGSGQTATLIVNGVVGS